MIALIKKTVFLISVLFSGLLLSSCLSGTHFSPVDKAIAPPFYQKDISKIAILVGKGSVYEKRQIELGALQALMANNYTIASRSDLKALHKELKFQNSGSTDSDSASFGKILNVPAVLVFKFHLKKGKKKNQFYHTRGGDYSLSARLIDVESGEALYIARGIDEDLEKIAFSLAHDIPSYGSRVAQITDEKGIRDFEKRDWKSIVTVPKLGTNFSKYKKVAVLVDTKSNDFRDTAEDMFMMAFLNKGVTVASRSDLKLVAKEINLQHSGLTDNDSVRLGKLLNVQAVVLVSAKQYKKKTCYPGSKKSHSCWDLGIMVKVIDIENGEILIAGGEYEGQLAKIIYDRYRDSMLKTLAQKTADNF